MTFKEQQDTLIEFLKNNYKNYLPSRINEPLFTTDFLDFDKYKGDFTVFVDFSRIDFRQSAYKDDCGDVENLSLTLYLVRRNNTIVILKDDILDSAFSLYQMIRKEPGFGIALNTVIDSIDFYDYIEGVKNLMCAEFALSLEIEL
jgi:hypothetical protein